MGSGRLPGFKKNQSEPLFRIVYYVLGEDNGGFKVPKPAGFFMPVLLWTDTEDSFRVFKTTKGSKVEPLRRRQSVYFLTNMK